MIEPAELHQLFSFHSYSKRTTDPPGAIVGFSTVVINEYPAETEISKDSSSILPDIRFFLCELFLLNSVFQIHLFMQNSQYFNFVVNCFSVKDDMPADFNP